MDDFTRFGSASLAQVAHLLKTTEERVVDDAVAAVGDGASLRGWLTADAVSALVGGAPSPQLLTEAEPLILEAFRQAHDRSKSGWELMTIPVLKNRLLQLSSQTFREDDYGSPSIWHFVTRFPGLLGCEGTRGAERVRLLKPNLVENDPDQPIAGALDPVGKGRMRVDLWKAAFDYSSEKVYIWDEAIGRARVRTERDGDLPVLPTISEIELRALRREFVEAQGDVSDGDASRLSAWVEGAGATAALPRSYRALWNAQLKSHAADRVRAFFIRSGLSVPTDLIEVSDAPAERESDVERARRVAHQYIDAMSGDELSRLSIEMSVVLRVAAS